MFFGSEEKMGQKTTNAIVQSQKKTYVGAQNIVQFASDGHEIGSFQASFRNILELKKKWARRRLMPWLNFIGMSKILHIVGKKVDIF